MKIAVTSTGASLGPPVDPRLGRAARVVVVGTATGAFSVHDNPLNLNAAPCAGIQAAETVSRLGAELVITGHCGLKAFRALQAAGIKVVTGATVTVQEALTRFQKGELQPATSTDLEGH